MDEHYGWIPSIRRWCLMFACIKISLKVYHLKPISKGLLLKVMMHHKIGDALYFSFFIYLSWIMGIL